MERNWQITGENRCISGEGRGISVELLQKAAGAQKIQGLSAFRKDGGDQCEWYCAELFAPERAGSFPGFLEFWGERDSHSMFVPCKPDTNGQCDSGQRRDRHCS